jgi:N-alpha-acetyl-L-2,4-diaminobutyrate deacetylase
VTERIAEYFQRYLIPLCDFALDIHYADKILGFIPLAAAHRLADKQQEAACIGRM